jgi:hypothetical protein
VPAPHVSWGATPKTTAESAHAPTAEATAAAESAATSLSKGGLGRTRKRDTGNKYKKEGFKEGGLFHLNYPHRLKSEVTALTNYPNFTCFDSLRTAKVAQSKLLTFNAYGAAAIVPRDPLPSTSPTQTQAWLND